MRKEIIGQATLYLGDCREILPELGKDVVIVTDPPYKLTATGGGIGAKRQYLADIDGHIDGGFDVSLFDGFENWLCFCSKGQLLELMTYSETRGQRWQLLTWNKTNPTPLTNNNYLPDTEYMIHAFKRHDYEGKQKFIVGQVEKSPYEHPSVKPLYVMRRAVISASHKGDTILDCFMGTGSTGVACLTMGRKFIGIEQEPKYFDIACQRIEASQQQLQLAL